MKKLLAIIGFLILAGAVQAAPASTILRNILPEANNLYEIGSTSPLRTWLGIYVQTASTTNLTVSALNAANCDVKSSTSGVFSCGLDATGGGGGGGAGADEFTYNQALGGNYLTPTSTAVGIIIPNTASSTLMQLTSSISTTSRLNIFGTSEAAPANNLGIFFYDLAVDPTLIGVIFTQGGSMATKLLQAGADYSIKNSADTNLFAITDTAISVSVPFDQLAKFDLGASTTILTISNLGNSNTRCLNVNNQGVVGVAAADCGTGGGGASFGKTFELNTANSLGQISLAPTSTVGLLVTSASSTFNGIFANYATTTNSTSTNINVSGAATLAGFLSTASSTINSNLRITGVASSSSFNITGTGGAGFITLVGQASNPTAPIAGTLLLHSVTANGFTRLEEDAEGTTNLIYGRDSVFVVKLDAGQTVTKGQVVYIKGTASGVPTVALARANSITTMPALGFMVDTTTDGSFGRVMRVGVLNSVDTSLFSEGATLYVSTATAGSWQTARPSGTTNFVQRLGTVLSQNLSTGSIAVTLAPFVGNMETGTNAIEWTGTGMNLTRSTTTNATTTNFNIIGTLDVDGLTSALVLTGAGGVFAEYTGTSCTNQFPRSLSALGAATCASVANTDLTNSTISGIALGSSLAALTATNGTLTFSGSYDGSTAITVGLNLASSNLWSAASTTINGLYANFGTTTYATSTNLHLTATGYLTIPQGTAPVVANVGQIAIDTTDDQFLYFGASSKRVLQPFDNLGFAYATTTWTGTTTLRIGPSPANITVTHAYCETDVGTLGMSLYDDTNRALFMVNASTTINKFQYSASNNTFTAGETIRVDIGNPATLPRYISCRFMYTYDAS